MEDKWVVAVWGNRKYAAFQLDDRGVPGLGDHYDPQDIRNHRLRWMMNTPITRDRAVALVDKLNGPRGDLTEV